MKLYLHRFALLVLASFGIAVGRAGETIVYASHVYQQEYRNGSQVSGAEISSGGVVTSGTQYFTTRSGITPPVGYHWVKTVVQTDYCGLHQEFPIKAEHTQVPYDLYTYENADTYESLFFKGNAINVSYDGNGATGGGTSSSSFTYDVGGTLAANGFTREFTVSYDANGGSVSPSSAKATSTFAHWSDTKSGSASYAYSSGQSGVKNPCGSTGGTVTLYARWSDKAVTLPTPTWTGHTFSGWYTAQTGGTRVGGGGDSYGPVAAGKTLYAQWAENSYTIWFKKGTYGSGTEQSLTKTHGTTLTLPGALFSRGGNTQKGWSYDVNGTTKDDDLNGSYTKDEATTLYPYWEANQYTITIMPGYDGGNSKTLNYSTRSSDQTINISVSSRNGWDHSSWQHDFSSVHGTQPTVNKNSILIPANTYGDFTITAQWTGKTYYITVSANGGTGGSQVTYTTSESEQTVDFKEPTRGGYTRGDWAVGSGYTGNPPTVSGQQVTIPANTYGAFTITPTWNGNTYSVTVQPGEGGSGGGTTSYTVSSTQWQWNFPAMSRTGHQVDTWAYAGCNAGTPSVSGTTLTIPANAYGNIVATPTWKANKASITYENYNQHGALHPEMMTYDQVVKVSKPTKTGNSFAGWQVTVGLDPSTALYSVDSGSTWQSISTEEMKVGARCETLYLKNLTAAPNGAVTLYANWGAQYTITTEADPAVGGTVSGGGTCVGGDTITLTATPNDGYSFEKWKDDATQPAEREITVSGDATYTACFTGNVYRVQFDAMEGGISGVDTFYVQVGHAYGAFRSLPEPTPPEEQQFDGWYTEKEGGELVTDDTTVSKVGNHTLYAHYKAIVHIYHYVRFDRNGATNETEMAVQAFVDGETKPLTANAYGKADYTFAGWATNSVDAASCRVTYTDGQSVSFPNAKANETNVLYAAWKVNQYPLSLQLSKGIGAIWYSVTNSSWNYTLTSTNIPVNCGDKWKSYATPSTGYSTQYFDTSHTTNGTMTAAGAVFAPVATPNTITVTYNGNGKTGGGTDTSTFYFDTPGNLTSNGFERIYKVEFFGDSLATAAFVTNDCVWPFVKWNDEVDGKGAYSYADGATVSNLCGWAGTDKAKQTLFAQWTTNVASVVVFPPAPEHEGYEFLGWGSEDPETFPQEDPPEPCWQPGDTYVADKACAFYAYWKTKVIPTGTFSLTPGTGVGKICYRIGDGAWSETTTGTNLTIDEGVVWSAYAVAKLGYVTNDTCSASGTMTEAGAAFSPVATPKKIAVHYDGNGATDGAMDPSEFTYDTSATLASNGYVRAYSVAFNAAGGSVTNAAGEAVDPFVTNGVYTFAGWATNLVDAAACRVAYTDGQSVKNLSMGDPVTLYAVWTTNAASAVTLPGATREDHRLQGWTQTGVAASRVYAVGESFIPTNDTRFVAQWRLEVGELSDAVGLTNAVLKGVADTENDVRWQKETMKSSGPGIGRWDWGHPEYVQLVGSGDANLDATSPLKLYVKLDGAGKFSYERIWGSDATIKLLDICRTTGGSVATNKLDDSEGNKQTSWATTNFTLTVGQHELVWLVSGTLETDDKIAIDNMTWTPDGGTEVKPGSEPTYETEAAAKAAAAGATVVRPNKDVEGVVSADDYKAMFTVRAVESSEVSGKWTLAVELTPTVSNEVQAAVDAAAGGLVSQMATSGGSLAVSAPTLKAGLYYGIAATNEVEWIHLAAPTNWVLGTGKGELTLSVDRPSPEAGFFRVRATAVPPR